MNNQMKHDAVNPKTASDALVLLKWAVEQRMASSDSGRHTFDDCHAACELCARNADPTWREIRRAEAAFVVLLELGLIKFVGRREWRRSTSTMDKQIAGRMRAAPMSRRAYEAARDEVDAAMMPTVRDGERERVMEVLARQDAEWRAEQEASAGSAKLAREIEKSAR